MLKVEAEFKHKLWYNNNFEYSFDAEKTFSTSETVQKQLEYSHDSLLKQSMYLDRVLELDEDDFFLELDREFSKSNIPSFDPLSSDPTEPNSQSLGFRRQFQLSASSSNESSGESDRKS